MLKQRTQEKFTNHSITPKSKQNSLNSIVNQFCSRKISRYNIELLEELLLTKSSLSSVIQSPLFKIIKNSSGSGIISIPATKEEVNLSQPPSKSLVISTQKEQTSSQAVNNCHTSLAPLNEKTHLRPNATLQIKILVELYWQLTRSDSESVKWSPSNLLGKGATDSQRASRSAAIRKLVSQGYVNKTEPNCGSSSKNMGNAGTYVSLTLKGEQEARGWIQLMQND